VPPPDFVPDTVTERGLTRTRISARDSSDNATVSTFNYTVLWNNTPSWKDLQQGEPGATRPMACDIGHAQVGGC
jgi:hypothetical protein